MRGNVGQAERRHSLGSARTASATRTSRVVEDDDGECDERTASRGSARASRVRDRPRSARIVDEDDEEDDEPAPVDASDGTPATPHSRARVATRVNGSGACADASQPVAARSSPRGSTPPRTASRVALRRLAAWAGDASSACDSDEDGDARTQPAVAIAAKAPARHGARGRAREDPEFVASSSDEEEAGAEDDEEKDAGEEGEGEGESEGGSEVESEEREEEEQDDWWDDAQELRKLDASKQVDEITVEPLDKQYILWRSPDGSTRMRFNFSTLKRIALRFGEWRQPPHFRTAAEARLRRQVAAKFGRDALRLPLQTGASARTIAQEDEEFFERLRHFQAERLLSSCTDCYACPICLLWLRLGVGAPRDAHGLDAHGARSASDDESGDVDDNNADVDEAEATAEEERAHELASLPCQPLATLYGSPAIVGWVARERRRLSEGGGGAGGRFLRAEHAAGCLCFASKAELVAHLREDHAIAAKHIDRDVREMLDRWRLRGTDALVQFWVSKQRRANEQSILAFWRAHWWEGELPPEESAWAELDPDLLDLSNALLFVMLFDETRRRTRGARDGGRGRGRGRDGRAGDRRRPGGSPRRGGGARGASRSRGAAAFEAEAIAREEVVVPPSHGPLARALRSRARSESAWRVLFGSEEENAAALDDFIADDDDESDEEGEGEGEGEGKGDSPGVKPADQEEDDDPELRFVQTLQQLNAKNQERSRGAFGAFLQPRNKGRRGSADYDDSDLDDFIADDEDEDEEDEDEDEDEGEGEENEGESEEGQEQDGESASGEDGDAQDGDVAGGGVRDLTSGTVVTPSPGLKGKRACPMSGAGEGDAIAAFTPEEIARAKEAEERLAMHRRKAARIVESDDDD